MSTRGRLLRGLVAAAATLLTLAGCSSSKEVSVLTCPQVYIVADAHRFVEYAPGEGRDLIDVRYDAQIVNVEWLCTFFTDENRVETEIRFGMRTMKGPSADPTKSSKQIPYFVAVADPSGTIIAKQVFGIDIGFPGNVLEVGHIESVFEKLTYAYLGEASHYTIYIGFQLTEQQLAEARAERAAM